MSVLRARLGEWHRTVRHPSAGADLTAPGPTVGCDHGGHDADGIRTAHADSSAEVQPLLVADRVDREAREAEHLAAGATRAVGAGNRAIEEEPDDWRTCFERDRDRIVHGTAFRRLAGKTQVFVRPDDHQRTRLTHALEVAQVAMSVARACRLNVALAEAIALGHDCGHGPFGHASEDALAPFVAGGYDHATWGADVVLEPLNLCHETLDGIRNHSWSRPAPSTPEGEVVSWADRIAYLCHDFEDAVDAGVVAAAELPAVVAERCGRRRREQLHSFIHALVTSTVTAGAVGMDGAHTEALGEFRRFNYERIYLRDESTAQAAIVDRLLGGLVECYAAEPARLAGAGRDLADDADVTREAVAFVGGMTDRFALRPGRRAPGVAGRRSACEPDVLIGSCEAAAEELQVADVRQDRGNTSTSLRPLREPNLTDPSMVAKRVSSPPLPTFRPGWNLVPRWRTRIEPADTMVPSNSLTPRRLDSESRPFRVEPPPLVLDMGALSRGAGPGSAADAGDLDDRVLLAVTPTLAVVGLVLVGEAVDLRALGVAHDPGRHGGAPEVVGSGEHRVAVDEEHGPEIDRGPFVDAEALDLDDVALGDSMLLPTGGDHCVHRV